MVVSSGVTPTAAAAAAAAAAVAVGAAAGVASATRKVSYFDFQLECAAENRSCIAVYASNLDNPLASAAVVSPGSFDDDRNASHDSSNAAMDGDGDGVGVGVGVGVWSGVLVGRALLAVALAFARVVGMI
jgi:hypothetical protein